MGETTQNDIKSLRGSDKIACKINNLHFQQLAKILKFSSTITIKGN